MKTETYLFLSVLYVFASDDARAVCDSRTSFYIILYHKNTVPAVKL